MKDTSPVPCPISQLSSLEFTEDGRCFTVDNGETVEFNNSPAAPVVPAAFAQLITFPAIIAAGSDPEETLVSLSAEVEGTGCLSESHAFLVATWIAASWLVDSLPVAPSLCVYGEPGTYALLRQLVRIVSRRSLPLGKAAVSHLTQFPMQLHPTLLLSAPDRTTPNLLAAISGARGTVYENCHTLACKSAAMAFAPAAFDGVISIPCDRVAIPYRSYSDEDCVRIRDTFVPLLAHYRLRQHAKAATSTFDIPTLGPEARMLARSLGPVLDGYPNLESQLAETLEALDRELAEDKADSMMGIVLDHLWEAAHGGKSEISIAALTEGLHVVSKWRHSTTISAKMVGTILRRDLGLRPIRRAKGFVLHFEEATQSSLHRAARKMGLLNENTRKCSFCEAELTAAMAPTDQV